MAYLRRLRAIAAFVTVAFVLASCGSGDSVETGEPGAQADSRPASISEQDISEARAAYESALADWTNNGLASYTLEVGVESIGLVRAQVVDGEVVSEEVDDAEVDEWFNEPVPRTVEELFAELDQIIAVFEDDPSKVPSGGECGYHLNAQLDPELGYPTYYDTLGPCDDGIGLTAKVIPEGSAEPEPAADPDGVQADSVVPPPEPEAQPEAVAQWQASEVIGYAFDIYTESGGKVRVDVDGDSVSEETLEEGLTDQLGEPVTPRTVEQLFAEVDEMIAVFEDDPSLIPSPGECGRHMKVHFDPEYGFPVNYSFSGPCDRHSGVFVSMMMLSL